MKLGEEFLYLTQEEVLQVGLTQKEVLDLTDEAFWLKGKGRVEMPPKIGVHPRDNDLCHAMPAWLMDRNIIGIKWVAGWIENPKKYGLPAVTGVLILNNVDNGQIECIMDCTWVSQARTGATCGVAARNLANPDSEIVGVMACGAQALTGLESIVLACPNIKKVYAYDINPEATKKYVQCMSEKLGIEIIPTATARETVEKADILMTSGPVLYEKSLGIIDPDWIKPGCTISALDFDTFFNPYFIDSCDKFYTDDLRQYNNFREMICKPYNSQPVELSDAMVGKYPLRESHDEIIYAMTIGLAIEDVIVGHEVYLRAKEMGIGSILKR